MAAAVLLVAGPVAAQGDRGYEDEAKALFDQATERFDSGDYEAALEKYRAAYRLAPRAKILLNIGATLLELERLADAANAFDDYLRHPDADRERIATVQTTLRDVDARLATLKLDVSVPGGVLEVDGTVIGKVPLTRSYRVTPGRHTVTVISSDGGQITTQAVDAAAGAAVDVRIQPPAPVQPEVVTVRSVLARIQLFVRTDGELGGRGAVVAPGVSVRVLEPLSAFAGGLIGTGSSGFELGARVALGRWVVRPTATAAVPVFFAEGVRPGGRAALGAAWHMTPRLAASVEVGASFAPVVPVGYSRAAFLVSVGLGFRLADAPDSR